MMAGESKLRLKLQLSVFHLWLIMVISSCELFCVFHRQCISVTWKLFLNQPHRSRTETTLAHVSSHYNDHHAMYEK